MRTRRIPRRVARRRRGARRRAARLYDLLSDATQKKMKAQRPAKLAKVAAAKDWLDEALGRPGDRTPGAAAGDRHDAPLPTTVVGPSGLPRRRRAAALCLSGSLTLLGVTRTSRARALWVEISRLRATALARTPGVRRPARTRAAPAPHPRAGDAPGSGVKALFVVSSYVVSARADPVAFVSRRCDDVSHSTGQRAAYHCIIDWAA